MCEVIERNRAEGRAEGRIEDEQEVYKLGFIPIWGQITKKMYKYFQ